MLHHLIRAIFSAAFFLIIIQAQAEECLTLASDTTNEKTVLLFRPGIDKVFEKAGVCIKHTSLPTKRIQKEILKGSIDGEYLRVKAYIKAMNGIVIPIPTPVVSGGGILISLKSSGFTPKTLVDVKDNRIGTIHGYKWHEVLSKRITNTKKAQSYPVLAKQLKAGRINGMLTDPISLARLIQAGLLPADDIHRSNQVIDLSVYVLLHVRNAKYITRLDEAMKVVKKEGGFKLGN